MTELLHALEAFLSIVDPDRKGKAREILLLAPTREELFHVLEEDYGADFIRQKLKKNEKPLCKYGISCFRKNPLHFEEFAHPWV